MRRTLEQYLEEYFSFDSFRTGQREIIEDVLECKDVLGILPTGSGKSLCYQLPARILKGNVIVVSPLISLMIDQVKQLKASGFKEVIAINSFLSMDKKQRALLNLQKYKLIYVSPEMLQNRRFVRMLSELHVSLFVIDEAHCISQWGHEFRPDYLRLGEVINKLSTPTVLALSATATPEVQDDISNQLGIKLKKHIYPMDRDNISFIIKTVPKENDKINYIAQLLEKHPVPTMIYFSSRKWTEKSVKLLEQKLPNLRIAFYHGGMEQTDRILIQQQFMAEQLDVICCTSAFGMGINKQNIRLIIHFHLPAQIESFIQEVGRAGRDGKSSVSLVLTGPTDIQIPKRLIETELPTDTQLETIIHYFKQCQEHSTVHAIDIEFVQQNFQLNEIQWRFLHYQFETVGLIYDGKLVPSFKEWSQLIIQMKQLVNDRYLYKYRKLDEMFSWVSGDRCRRVELFASFQSYTRKPKYACCDICNFTFEQWTPEFTNHINKLTSWQEELKELLLQGESK